MTALILLVWCPRCRNRMLYLLRPWPGWRTLRKQARLRVRATPLNHPAHKRQP